MIMTNYYVVAPFEPMTEEELNERKEELIKAGRKVLAIVFNCKDREDFERKWFKD